MSKETTEEKKVIYEITKEEMSQIRSLIDDLGWDYDRMSGSGQETYDKLCVLFKLDGGEK